MAHVRERPSLRESVIIEVPSGKQFRWADDEPLAANVPSGEQWSDAMPGGYETQDVVLPRKAGVDYGDVKRFARATRFDASGGIIWQGRLTDAPRVSGDQMAITPSAVGYQAHLDDDKSVRTTIVDRDLSHWQPPSPDRRLNLIASGVPHMADATAGSGEASALLVLPIQGAWAAGKLPLCQATYDAGPGVAVARVDMGFFLTTTDANFSLKVNVAATDTLSASESSADLATGSASGSTSFTPVTPLRYSRIIWATGVAPGGTDGQEFTAAVNPIVFGDTGITLRVDSAGNVGVLDADAIAYALDTWCPLISWSSDSLTAAPFVIPQLVFLEPTTVSEIVRQSTRFGVRDWAVWDGPMFWLHDRGARGRRWRARVGPTRLEETGPQVDRLWNGIIVAYQDVDGSTRTAGPIGSGSNVETAELEDADPENPANQLQIRRWDMLVMGTSTSAGAIQVGRKFLQDATELDTSGHATFYGYVEDDRGVMHPYSHVKSGDQVTFVDASDTSYRHVVHTDKTRADRSCGIDLDAPPESLQALLERLQVVLVPLGIS